MEIKNVSKDIKIAAGQFVKEKEYWINQLFGEIEKCHFPYDNYKESIVEEYRKDVVTFKITGDIYSRLMEITGRSYPKLHMVLVAGVTTLSYLYIGNRDMIVGTSIEKQDTEDSLINTVLPLRVQFPGNMTFKELILEIRRIINEAIENQNYPIETLISERNLLSDVVVLLENIQEKKYVEHLQASIVFSFRETVDAVEGELEYSALKYEKDSIIRIIDHLLRLLHIALFNVNVQISDIQLLSEEEENELNHFNNTAAVYPHQKTIHQLFEEQASKIPDHIAIVCKGAFLKNRPLDPQKTFYYLTYRQLSIQSNQLAALLFEKGVLPETIVGIIMERSVAMIIGILGILKAGGTYLPIDPEYPQERINYILKDSRAKILIIKSEAIISKYEIINDQNKNIEALTVLNLDHLNFEFVSNFGFRISDLNSSNLAYIIYTSGSTGKPKGVAVQQRALVNYTWWAAKNYIKNEKVSFPLYTSMGFDLTVTSLFPPLVTGNTVYIYRGESKEFLLENIFAENKVEAVKLTPVHLMIMGNNPPGKNKSKIKRFIVGGDQLETQWARKIHENFGGNVEIYNEYGPTEATVGCMIYKYNPGKDKGSSVPIGVPADNVQIYLLDKLERNVPVGGIGELYIGGDGLARGYLNNPELTAERFNRPYRSNKTTILYKTGDLVRRLNDGNIEFLGRLDQQVKIRGYRIETGEIENFLVKHDHIHQAVVVAREDARGYKYLAAYIVPDGKGEKISVDPVELRNYLSKHLPEFMIPSYFIKLEKIPLTANGKIDKKALPHPDKNTLETGAEYQPPTTGAEKLLVEIWQDVMGVERVGITDNYFSLGGDSIKSIQISALLYNANWRLELKDLFQYGTIKELANHLKPIKELSFQGIIEGEVKLTPIQEWFFERNFTDPHHFNLSVMLHNPEGFDEAIIKKVFNKIIEHHDALRMVFKKEGGRIKQINKGLPGGSLDVDIEVFDVKTVTDYQKEINEKCNHLQGGIDLTNGPLVKLGLFKSNIGDYLLIAIHHLVMDTVSWMIIFEDFTSLYRQIESGIEGEKLELPLKSASYKEWAEKLVEYSNNRQILQELDYWQKLNNIEAVAWTNKEKITCKVKDSQEMAFELSGEYTEKLLKHTNGAYNTETNDILLTALGLAASDWTGSKQIPLVLEGHGREEIMPDININRTVGWFASMYPVILDITNKGDIAAVIKDTKEMIREVPSKGIGYGILKYLTGKENKPAINWDLEPGISFNYLGQFHEDRKQKFFHLTEMPQGNTISLNSEMISPLYILAIVFKGTLKITMNYAPGYYAENQIREFAAGYKKYLVLVIDHCTVRKESEFTLSDYSVSLPEKEAEIVFDFLSKIKLDE